MKRWTLGLVLVTGLLVGLSGAVSHGQQTTVLPIGDAFAFEQLTVSTAAVPFTVATYAPTGGIPAKAAYVTVETQPIRYKFSGGTAPSSSVGHLGAASGWFVVVGSTNVANFRMIRQSSSDSTVNVTYLR